LATCKEHAVIGSSTFDILRAVQAGYAVLIQDVRGRYACEGAFDPMFQENRDGGGSTVVEWRRGRLR